MIHRSKRGRSILNVKMRATTARRKRQRLAAIASTWALAIILIGTAAWFGVSKTLDRFFYKNPAYNLSELTLELDGIMTGEDLVAITGIQPGDNVFNIDLEKAVDSLKTIPMVQDASIERFLPDRIKITLVSRRPVAWVSSGNDINAPYDPSDMLLADDTGLLMKPMMIRQEHHQLPVIYGLKSRNYHSGHHVNDAEFDSALMLLRHIRLQSRDLVAIRSLDISKSYRLNAYTTEGSKVTFSPVNFQQQLEKLSRLLGHCRETGRTLDSVNLMVQRNTPVVFAMAPLPPELTPSKQSVKSPKPRN